MQHNKWILLFFIILFTSSSCKKSFLDTPDKTNILRQAYITDLKTSGDFLNGIYVELATKFFTGYSMVYPELIGDNIKPVSTRLTTQYGWSQLANDDRRNSLVGTEVNMNPLWLSGYRIVRDCSFIIESVDQYRNEDETIADNLKGQAYTLRAFAHFVLVNIFAQSYNFSADGSHPGIPYIKTSDWAQPVTKQTVAEVYSNIISDLQNAILLLPSSQKTPLGFEKSVVNLNAAKSFLARAYLFKGDFRLAKDLAVEVGLKVPIMTGANYPSKLFTQQETEAIFQLPPGLGTVAGSAGNYSTSFQGLWFVSPVKYFVASKDISTILRENLKDVRSAWVSLNGGDWEIKKYPQNVVPVTSLPASSYFQTIIRSSEMYLTAAESYAKLGSNFEDSARYFLDAIRKRANPSVIATSDTGSALLDSIYKERRKELAFEGLRMFDLLRWKKGVSRSDGGTTSQHLTYPNNNAIAPLPTSDLNLYGFDQNSGY